VKTGSKSISRKTAQDHSIIHSKNGLLIILPFLLLISLVGRILWKYLRKTSLKVISPDGYILVNGKSEHRLIAERVLGRKLALGEVVHHIDGIKTNNRESNLCVLDNDTHNRFHVWLKWMRDKYKRYPSKKYQRAVLQRRYNGILLVTYEEDVPVYRSNKF
jgi:hypothetical protein